MRSRNPIAPQNDATAAAPVLTSTAAEMLAAEINRLRDLRDREFTARRREALSVAQSDGDAHLAIGEDEIVVNARIAHLEALMRQAKVLDHTPAGDDLVGLGSRVTVEDVASGRTFEYVLVGWHDGAPGTVSAASPVGQALLGRGPGEEATIALPDGRRRDLRVVAVEQPSTPLL